MRKIIVFVSLTLDGVMQAPGRADEDRRGGFEHGGWAAPYATMETSEDNMSNTNVLLLGRRTYEDFYSVWPHRTNNPFTEILNNTKKYVPSRTLEEPLPWSNSTLLKGDAAETVASLKEEEGEEDIVVLGSGELVQSLMRHDLVDKYVLSIHPLILGSGRHLFRDEGMLMALRLVGTKTTSTGIVIATYEPQR